MIYSVQNCSVSHEFFHAFVSLFEKLDVHRIRGGYGIRSGAYTCLSQSCSLSYIVDELDHENVQ